MRNIKTYTDFIFEYYNPNFDTRSTPIEVNESNTILDIIKNNAPWYLENIKDITPIYRGVKRDNEQVAMTIEPALYTRHARNTENYYMSIIDESEYWKDYPKRSKSIICSLSKSKASRYGKVYRVIPLIENSRLAICPWDDVYYSFPVLFKNIEDITGIGIRTVALFNDWLAFGFGIEEDVTDSKIIANRVNSVIKDMMFMAANPDKYYKDYFNTEVQVLSEKILKGELQYTNFYSQLEEWMQPDSNGYKIINYNRDSTQLGKLNEVYTDANCLLVLEDELQLELSKQKV